MAMMMKKAIQPLKAENLSIVAVSRVYSAVARVVNNCAQLVKAIMIKKIFQPLKARESFDGGCDEGFFSGWLGH